MCADDDEKLALRTEGALSLALRREGELSLPLRSAERDRWPPLLDSVSSDERFSRRDDELECDEDFSEKDLSVEDFSGADLSIEERPDDDFSVDIVVSLSEKSTCDFSLDRVCIRLAGNGAEEEA